MTLFSLFSTKYLSNALKTENQQPKNPNKSKYNNPILYLLFKAFHFPFPHCPQIPFPPHTVSFVAFLSFPLSFISLALYASNQCWHTTHPTHFTNRQESPGHSTLSYSQDSILGLFSCPSVPATCSWFCYYTGNYLGTSCFSGGTSCSLAFARGVRLLQHPTHVHNCDNFLTVCYISLREICQVKPFAS